MFERESETETIFRRKENKVSRAGSNASTSKVFLIGTRGGIIGTPSLNLTRFVKNWDIISFVSTRTQPGHRPKFRDCPGHSGTLGNYERGERKGRE